MNMKLRCRYLLGIWHKWHGSVWSWHNLCDFEWWNRNVEKLLAYRSTHAWSVIKTATLNSSETFCFLPVLNSPYISVMLDVSTPPPRIASTAFEPQEILMILEWIDWVNSVHIDDIIFFWNLDLFANASTPVTKPTPCKIALQCCSTKNSTGQEKQIKLLVCSLQLRACCGCQ